MEEQFQDLFKIRRNRKKVEIGNILIAEPFLEGKYFSRSVIFIVEHDDKGTIGFVLNKPMGHTTSELVTELGGVHLPVYIGGPVEQNQLYYIHTHSELDDALHIANGIYWGGDFVQLAGMLKSGQILSEDIRFFSGYSGWESGQLGNEMEDDTWMVGDITKEYMFTLPDENIWENSMRGLGERYKVWANFPEDPIMN